MTIRTFVGYVRKLWSWLGKGVANDKIKLSPSIADPCIPAQKNCGALSPNMAFLQKCETNNLNVANPIPEWMYAQQSSVNPYWERMSHIELTAAQSKANYQAVADHYAKLSKFKKQIVTFERLKEKRSRVV